MLPGLLLNYFGQAALLISEPDAIESPFYRMAPDFMIWPLAILATMASVVASQALISGAYSLTVQAVQLDYLPRVEIRHTSGEHQGQVYVPLVNWLLMIGCIGLVIGFRTSSKLAARVRHLGHQRHGHHDLAALPHRPRPMGVAACPRRCCWSCRC